jgi:uncharacterized protein YozE (UPF0346 family)
MSDLYNFYLANRNDKGVPILSTKQWQEINEKYDKETIIEELVRVIDNTKPPCPLKNLTYEGMQHAFWALSFTDLKHTFLSHDVIKDRVIEKFEDYGRNYQDHGLGVIQMGSQYNEVSNFFHQHLRYNCDAWGFKSPIYRWQNSDNLRNVFLALWRLGNDQLSNDSYIMAFRLSAYIATQFKPQVAKFLYEITNAKTVFDSSCGWGDRLAGFYCSNAKEYYGTDPNDQTFVQYKKQCIEYETFLSGGNNFRLTEGDNYFIIEGVKRVEIHRMPAEDFDYSLLPPIDCAFTSPPYFATEKYNTDGINADEQSWSRYTTYEQWRDGFYLPVNRKTFNALSENGYQFVNIMDPKIKTKRYYASDDLIDDMVANDAHFSGQLGMRIMQRPKNIPKDQLDEFMNKIYIEPVWTFSKKHENFDLIDKYMNKGALDSFFA